MKENYPDTVCLVKCGMFYRCYEQDAYIISYLLNYKLKSSFENDMAGFPRDSIDEVKDTLTFKKINYKIFQVNKKSGINIQSELDFNEENCYDDIYEKAYRYIKLKSRINRISDKLITHIENIKIDDILNNIENTVYKEL